MKKSNRHKGHLDKGNIVTGWLRNALWLNVNISALNYIDNVFDHWTLLRQAYDLHFNPFSHCTAFSECISLLVTSSVYFFWLTNSQIKMQQRLIAQYNLDLFIRHPEVFKEVSTDFRAFKRSVNRLSRIYSLKVPLNVEPLKKGWTPACYQNKDETKRQLEYVT